MDEAGQPSLTTGSNVYRTTNNHRCDRKAPQKARNNVPRTLSDQFSIGRRHPLLVVELIDSFQIEQCLEGCHNGNGHCSEKHRGA